MADAFIYDAVRTPRGRGKPDGALHEVSTLGLAVTASSSAREPMIWLWSISMASSSR